MPQTNTPPIIAFPRGSEWRKWDLHVHTPASIVHWYSGADPWESFLRDLESLPPEFKVLGINDYLFLDGYRRILDERRKGRLKNIDLVLPVIELRLDKFGGSQGKLSRVNFHIIFSDKIDPDIIEQQFLNALTRSYQVTPQYAQVAQSKKWAALPTRKSIEDLGTLIIESVPSEEKARFGSPLLEGFNNLCFSLEKIEGALGAHYFEKKFVTAVGKTEWADIKWTDQSIAEKKNIINSADLVFIASQTPDDWAKAKKALTDGGVNDRLLDCSDAHTYSSSQHKDRIGNSFTWIKADPTFAGLLQVFNEPEERVFVGQLPPQLELVRKNPTKYIDALKIDRKSTATLAEQWFDNKLLLNPGLVAIIGNKGKGKSALTDIIGLLANTRQNKDFTFLSADNFRQIRDNKAKHFQATLTWASSSQIRRGLEELVDERQPELVKYIPQNFLEKICTQLGKIEESDFDRELKKVIFSHVDDADRLGKSSLDDLVAYKTSEASNRIAILKQELNRINAAIVEFEEQNQPDNRRKIENLLAVKRKELEAVEKSKPAEVAKPELDPLRQEEMAGVSSAIEAAKKRLIETENQISSSSRPRVRGLLDFLLAGLSSRNRLADRNIGAIARMRGNRRVTVLVSYSHSLPHLAHKLTLCVLPVCATNHTFV